MLIDYSCFLIFDIYSINWSTLDLSSCLYYIFKIFFVLQFKVHKNKFLSTFRETFGDATPEIFFQIFWVVNNQSIALYLHALYIVKREFCRLKILQEFSRESWIIFIYSTYIQKDCFSFCTVLESATRWRYIQRNISPFHSFCPLAPSISQKLKLFFGQSYPLEIEQTQQMPFIESHIDQNVRPLFFYPQWNKKLHGSVFEFCLYPV